jgi:hypothetical protein
MVLAGSIQPAQAIAPKPIIATARAKAHWRRRVVLRMSTQSLMAPMVQKWPRWINTPVAKDRANPRAQIWTVSVCNSSAVMGGMRYQRNRLKRSRAVAAVSVAG